MMIAEKTSTPAKLRATGAAPDPASPESGRLASLDAYRGFVILMMIFVNFLPGMPGVPSWLLHAAAAEDRFTLPDLVFPGFLLMVGLSIPLAFHSRIGGRSLPTLPTLPLLPSLKRILPRAVGLLAVGVLYEECSRYDASAALLPKSLFVVLFYLAVAALWLRHEKKKPWMAAAAAGVLLLLMFLYRGTVSAWSPSPTLSHGWWGILGLIGWSYLACSLLYLASKGSGTALMGCLLGMLALYMGEAKGVLDFVPQAVKGFVGIGSVFGTTSAGVMAGVIAGRWLLVSRNPPAADASAQRSPHLYRIRNLAVFAAFLIAAGYLLRPYGGISKINATPSFALVTAGICLAAYLGFYALMEVFKWRAWAAFLAPAGANALLAYILPDFWNHFTALVGLGKVWWTAAWPFLATGGAPGILNAAAVSLSMVLLTHLLTKAGVRLRF